MEQARKNEVMQFARGIYTFALRGCVDFDTVVEYLKLLGCKVCFYTDKEADELNKRHNCSREGVDFRKIHAATTWTPKRCESIVYFHKRKGRPSKELMLHSALHELGHILLNHYRRLDEERELCEEEAEDFYNAFMLIKNGKVKSLLGGAAE